MMGPMTGAGTGSAGSSPGFFLRPFNASKAAFQNIPETRSRRPLNRPSPHRPLLFPRPDR